MGLNTYLVGLSQACPVMIVVGWLVLTRHSLPVFLIRWRCINEPLLTPKVSSLLPVLLGHLHVRLNGLGPSWRLTSEQPPGLSAVALRLLGLIPGLLILTPDMSIFIMRYITKLHTDIYTYIRMYTYIFYAILSDMAFLKLADDHL